MQHLILEVKMSKRHFLLQAHKFEKRKHDVAGQLLSEKLDGHRCFWDGGITTGIPCPEIPWANIANHSKIRMSTGLWSRYGNPIHAPVWFTDMLPPFPLDGELWKGRGKFQSVSSTVKKHVPVDSEWEQIKFMVFDSPNLRDVLYDSIIDQKPNYVRDITGSLDYITRVLNKQEFHHSNVTYSQTLLWMHKYVYQNKVVTILDQFKLSPFLHEALDSLDKQLAAIMQLGGEGVVLRNPSGFYIPERSHDVTKHKPYHDSEGTVIGYITGRETDRGSKLLGMMGAMIVEWRGKTFELSGFTGGADCGHKERQLTSDDDRYPDDAAMLWAEQHPETEVPDSIWAKHFPRGSSVTFKYRELSDDGIPKEAAYLRKFEVL